jgi:murein DD-endopeptidase MepM/ murein hydrolase activator NlpD
MAKSYPFRKTYPVGTKWRYSSGMLHAAYDFLTPIGTDVLAVRDGVIIDCHEGENPNSPNHNYPGEPSNWVLLGYKNALGQWRTVYYQHLYDHLVTKGQKVKAGQHIGNTGNSGNSTGAHCHIHTMKGWRTRDQRYWNYKAAYRIYPPSLVWAKTSL